LQLFELSTIVLLGSKYILNNEDYCLVSIVRGLQSWTFGNC